MTVPSAHTNGEVLMWRRGADADAVVHYTPEGWDLIRQFLAIGS